MGEMDVWDSVDKWEGLERSRGRVRQGDDNKAWNREGTRGMGERGSSFPQVDNGYVDHPETTNATSMEAISPSRLETNQSHDKLADVETFTTQPQPISTRKPLTSYPLEILHVLIDNITDHLSLLSLSQTCTFFSHLFKDDPHFLARHNETFDAFEKQAPWDYRTQWTISDGRTVQMTDRNPNFKPKLVGLKLNRMPCYSCRSFKYRSNFLTKLRKRGFRLKGEKSTQRVCLDCIVHGRGIDMFNRSGATVQRFPKWEEGVFAQMTMLVGRPSWRLAGCAGCGACSWQTEKPSVEQSSEGLCQCCFRGERKVSLTQGRMGVGAMY